MSYTPYLWETGEIITADKLNHIENGIGGVDDAISTIEESYTELSNDVSELETELVGNDNVTITFARKEVVDSNVYVYAGRRYRIWLSERYSTTTRNESRLNIFSRGDTSKYVMLYNDMDYIDFTPTADGILAFYNYGGYIGSVNVRITSMITLAVDSAPIEYYVKTNNAEYTSIMALLLDLKDDDREKIIYIDGGDYDIFAEYKSLQNAGKLPTVPTDESFDYITGYVPYNVFVPTNTHIIGRGLVRLIYRPTTSETTQNESKTISPLNVAGSMTIENVEIYGKNCRYCIHDDPLQDSFYNGSIKKYVNVKAVKEVSDSGYGFNHCVGTGIGREMTYIYDGCTLENRETDNSPRTLYFHDRSTVGEVELQEKMSSRIIVRDSVIIADTNTYAIFLGNIGTTNQLRIKTDIEDSYIGGAIIAGDNGAPSQGNNRNSFDIKVLFSKYVLLKVRNESNIYTPQVYAYS